VNFVCKARLTTAALYATYTFGDDASMAMLIM
jgi:hypothetical protein